MPHSRTRLTLEALEARENPAALFTETFDALTPPALPLGWTTWSSDGTATFTSAPAVGANGTAGLVSEAGSRTAALAWHPQTVSADTGAAVSMRVDSLVGSVTIHYDIAALDGAGACPPVAGASCQSCAECPGQGCRGRGRRRPAM